MRCGGTRIVARRPHVVKKTRYTQIFSTTGCATFEGEFSDVTDSYAGKGVVRYAW
jgi:hypothetical protein